MTGARDGRSDGSKQQGSGPALFPRLHVAETKRAGPRGPPRNKMALFEQLTIPSHKFKPSPMALPSSSQAMKSPAMTTPIYLPIPQMSAGSHDSMYPYMPMNYMNPSMMPTMACIPGYSYSGLFSAEATHSMNTSGSKSTIMDGAEEAPFVGGAVPKPFGHSKFQAHSKQTRRGDDFVVPTYSSVTQSSGQTTRPSSPFHFQVAPRGLRPSPGDKGPVIQKRSPVIQSKCMEVTSSERKDNGGWSTASGECVTVCVTGNEVDSQETGHSEMERIPSSESYPATAPIDKVCRADSLNGPSEQDMHSNVFSENQSWEDSEPFRQGRGSSAESGSSMLDNVPAGSVQFQDVVGAFGQREFWKTRNIMIRQQRIFSRQVFQLHRAIEVQKFLAKALCSSTSIDEALEKEDDNVHMAESPVDEVPQAESLVAEVPEVPSIAEAPQVPEIAERHPETKVSNENSRAYLEPPHQPFYPLPVHTQQAFNREAPWPASPYAPNPWAVRMASSFMYVPYPGPYPPGYGAYPMMGAPMPMYAPLGALQQQPAQFPTWQQQQSGMLPVMGAQDPTAMAAWYGQQVGAPAAAMAPSSGIAAVACHLERFTASGSGQSVESTSHIAGACQAGQAEASFDARQADRDGTLLAASQADRDGTLLAARQADRDGTLLAARQADRGGTLLAARQADRDGTLLAARQADRDGTLLAARQADQDGTLLAAPQADEDGTLLAAREADRDGTPLAARQAGLDGENSNKGSSRDTLGWAEGWGRKEGRWVRGDRSLVHKRASNVADLRGNEADCQNSDTAREGGCPGHGGFQRTNDCHPTVEPEAHLEGRQEGVASLKHMRSEVALDSGACRWFPILSPSKRPMHHNGVIKVVPRAVSATPELAANILLSIQTDRRQ